MADKPEMSIEYCVEWGYLPDAVSLAEKMLKEFSRKLSAVKLVPGAKGSFEITIGTDLVFSKLDLGRFPETKEVREMVKARV